MPGVPMTGVQKLLHAMAKGIHHSRFRAAEHPDAHPSTLSKLSRDPSFAIREVVAANRATPPKVLHSMALKDNTIHGVVSKNPATTPDTLTHIMRQSSPWNDSWAEALRHPKTTLPMMQQAAADNPHIRGDVMHHLLHG